MALEKSSTPPSLGSSCNRCEKWPVCTQGSNETNRSKGSRTVQGWCHFGFLCRYHLEVQWPELRAVQAPRGSELAGPLLPENAPAMGPSNVHQRNNLSFPEGKAIPTRGAAMGTLSWEDGGALRMSAEPIPGKESPRGFQGCWV